DQDDVGSIDTMPNVQKLARQGVTFRNSFVTDSLCGPSRTAFLTGQYSHNNGVLVNEGAYDKFAPREKNSLGAWLQNAGYVTGFMGKFINGYGKGDALHIPPGWDEWDAFIRKANYWNYSLNENGKIVSYHHNDSDYSTDVLSRKAVDFIQKRLTIKNK